MRNIYLLFVLFSFQLFAIEHPQYGQLVPAIKDQKDLYVASVAENGYHLSSDPVPWNTAASLLSPLAHEVIDIMAETIKPKGDSCWFDDDLIPNTQETGNIRCNAIWNNKSDGVVIASFSIMHHSESSSTTCPNGYNGPITFSSLEWCYKKNYSDFNDNNECPDSSPDDINISPTGGGKRTFCFNNPNGSQCKITTNDDGSYTMPSQYVSQEMADCGNAVNDPDADPLPTTDPDEPSPTRDADATPQSNELDAINQQNNNLDVINDNLNNFSKANTDRLNQLVDEIQNQNILSGEIKDNSYNSAEKQNTTNELLHDQKQILESIEAKLASDSPPDEPSDETITATANRSTGGLNNFFTDADKAKLTAELDAKKQALTDVYTQIQNDVTDRFNFSSSISGTYESRTITWNGHQKEIGASRLSENFFKQLAPIVLLVCSIIALGILLWE